MGLAMDPSRRHRGFLIGIILYLAILMRVESASFDAVSSNARGMASTGLNNALNSVGGLYSYTSGLQGNMRSSGRGDQSALTACLQTLQDSQDQLKTSQSQLASIDPNKYQQQIADALTWASAALTYHTTCMDGFSLVAGQTKNNVMNRAFGVTMALNNAVSLVAALNTVAGNPTDTHNRRLQSVSEPERPVFEVEGDFPKWMPAADRRLLQTTTTLTIANAVVAKDGSGNYKTVQAAIDAAPKQSSKRWVIRVKAGTYYENVIVPKDSTYIMLMGDGMGKTIISASLSVAGSNVTTYLTATVAAQAANFIARDLTIRNTAGAINHQAVALKVQGDLSAFWRCSLEGYQDTLYALSNRQFYKNCTIYGTVDFIFGNAAAVFQTCNLLARPPLAGQQNTFTAQGRTSSSQNTGFSFQNCLVDAGPALKALKGQTVSSYFGRPWKLYSRTVFLTCTVTNVIDPSGWLPWNGNFALSTLFYGEYKNTGSGSGTGKRVAWSTQITDPKVANKYTVNQFISAATWLAQTTVDYSSQLYS